MHRTEFIGICLVMDMSPTPINVFKNMPCKNTMNDSPINATISKKIFGSINSTTANLIDAKKENKNVLELKMQYNITDCIFMIL